MKRATMTVAELIEKLRQQPQDAAVYVMGEPDCETPTRPKPEYCDWGDRNHPDRGVYL